MIKTPAEIAKITENCQHTVGAFRVVEAILSAATIVEQEIWYEAKPLTSEIMHQILQEYFAAHELHSPEGMIVACGADAAEPHHAGEGRLRPQQTIVVDLFPQSQTNGCFADMTRTYIKGEPTAEQARMYQVVQQTQLASLAALTPGITAAALYEVSAKIITDAGFPINKWEPGAVGYIHSLGHGLGTSVHEAPKLGRGDETVLVPGMVLTIEPGLYDPAHGGIRIEDTVVVTESGYQNLTEHPVQFQF